jgi:lipopolysaccharide transport system permease protein
MTFDFLTEGNPIGPAMIRHLRSLFKSFVDFLLTIYLRRFLILEMAKRDIAANHVGSLLGFFWTFINPLVLICILWVVFSVGFKTAPAHGVPFAVWLTAGMAIWNTFAEALNGSTGVIKAHPYLVKKVVFPLSILPVVKLTAAFVTHLVFVAILVILLLANRLPFSLYWFQALYYLLAMTVLVLGLSWLTAALNILIKDTGQIVAVLLQLGFWATPIFWDIEMMPQKLRFVFRVNPMFYVVQGYRESFLYFIPFWHHWHLTMYFWGVTAVFLVTGALVFQRLKPHFADLL